MSGAPQEIAIVVLGARAVETARRVQAALPGAAIHGPRARVPDADIHFDRAPKHLRGLFARGVAIVGLCASGILIRSLAPLLGDKTAEPPVVALSEDGRHAVPLLGGHRGANRIARALADALGGAAAVTTASDTGLGLALDDPPPGWRLAPGSDVKTLAADLLAGEPVRLSIEAGRADWLLSADLPIAEDATRHILVTDRRDSEADAVLHPAVLAVGVGCERGAEPSEVTALVEQCLADAGLSALAVACVASLDVKCDEPAIHAVAERLGVPARFFDAQALEAETPRLTAPSDAVLRAVGCHGVAEAAALACSGPDGALVVAKTKSARATCAIARATDVIGPETLGRARGQVMILGLGPGSSDWRSPAVTAALAAADDVVGYQGYLDLIRSAVAGKALHAFALGEEEARARAALELARDGHRVALVSSGDAGVYGMASLVFELLEDAADPAWRRVDITVEPGISALQAAAARAGAPLGHDFCAISLSDLLTPWPAIERRLHAAADADFVVALYNPASRARRALLGRAVQILSAHRPPHCPVVVARRLGRPGEAVSLTTLEDFSPADVDMLTLLIIGNGETRVVETGDGRRWTFTPRGYAAKNQRRETGAA